MSEYPSIPLNRKGNKGEGHKNLQPAPQDDKPRRESKQSVKENTDKTAAGPAYHNPDPLIWINGQSKEATFVVEGVETMDLIANGAHMSTIMEGFCNEIRLAINPLEDCDV